MADLSAYIAFSIGLDKSVSTPIIRLADTSNYPLGVPNLVKGVFTITQPDGVTITGNINTPDIQWNGSTLNTATKELRLATDGNFQNGTYTIMYLVQAAGYSDTALTHVFTIDYSPAVLKFDNTTDVYAPLIKSEDATNYSIVNFNSPSIVRAWSATIDNVAGVPIVITNTTSSFGMSYGGNYYDAQYSITLSSTVSYASSVYNYLTVIDKIVGSTIIDAYTPLSLAQIRSALATMKIQISNGTYCGLGCGCNCGCGNTDANANYAEAVTIYQEISIDIEANETADTYLLQTDLTILFYCQDNRMHTGAIIPPYGGGGDTFPVFATWVDTDPYTQLQTSDNLSYQFTGTMSANNPVVFNTTGGGGGNHFYVFKFPASRNNKTLWKNTELNQGTIPDAVMRDIFITNGFKYVVSRASIALDPTQSTTLS